MNKLLKASVLGLCAFAARADESGLKTWTQAVDMTGSGSEASTRALVDLSYWKDSSEQLGSGAPTDGDILDVRNRIRIRSSNDIVSPAHAVILSQDINKSDSIIVQDLGGTIGCANEGFILKCGTWYCNKGDSVFTIGGKVTAETTSSSPFIFSVCNSSAKSSTIRLTGELWGGSGALVHFGENAKPWSATAQNTTIELHDISHYQGKLTVSSQQANSGTDFGMWLKLADAESAATVEMKANAVLSTLRATDRVTIGSLSMAANDRLVVCTGTNETTVGCITAGALSVTGPIEVWVTDMPQGQKGVALPILKGPAGSIRLSDFTLVKQGLAAVYGCELVVNADGSELSIVFGGNGVIVRQTSHYAASGTYDEGSRDGYPNGPDARLSLTNATFWSDGEVPHGNVDYVTSLGLRTPYTWQGGTSVYSFPGDSLWLENGHFICQYATVEVPVIRTTGTDALIGLGTSHKAGLPFTLRVPHFQFLSGKVTVRAFGDCHFVLDGEIEGDADISFDSWDGTSVPAAFYQMTGCNTNFTGAISVSQGEYRSQYISFESKFPTLFVEDGRNLGGRRPTFDPRALTLTHMARLSVTTETSVVLADGLNRGVYVHEKGRFYVEDADGVIDCRWPTLLSGKMWKEGPGTLVLGGAMKHETTDGGELSDIPRAGSNLVEIAEGTVRVAHASALAGAMTTVDAGAAISVAVNPADPDLTRYGIRNVTVDTPFALADGLGGELPITLDATGVDFPEGAVLTNGLVTVSAAAAPSVRGMIRKINRPWKGIHTRLVERANPDGTVTFAAESFKGGLVLIFR